ncbi:MAG: hypothetical protein M3288_01050 [Thermoproteota archaeon]|nr:hypothetical protein [Thermoproteota archaeon]
MSEQSKSSLEVQSGKHAIKGLVIHLTGFVLGFLGIGLVLGGVIDIESGITVLVPFADMLYGLGLIVVVAVASKIGLPMKYLVVAGAVIGIGLFYKSAPHEIHIASGTGFGLIHPAHIMLGMILIVISATALTVLAIRHNTSNQRVTR